jgi:sigma-B regulation protein RsbU (phosphoserine phosphatase)
MSDSNLGFRSLTWRLTIWILATVVLVYLGTLAYSNLLARDMMLDAAEREAYAVTMAEVGEIQRVLRSVEESTQFLAAVLERLEPSEDKLHEALGAFAAGDERIYGSTAAYAPYGFDASTERFSPYYYVGTDGELAFTDLANASYRYWEQHWYTPLADGGEARWSEPYIDEGGGEAWMVTYSVPFFRNTDDGGREFRGVATADVSLDWLHEQVRGITVGETGYGVILSREGQVISHPDETLMRQLAVDGADRERLPEVDDIVASMMRGESGFQPFTDRYLGQRTRLTYAPVGHAGWSLAIIYPEDELFANLRATLLKQLGLLLAGLVLLVGVVVTLSRRLTQPIKELAAGAAQIATGDLDSELPHPRSGDEVGALTQSFRDMRDSLKTYIRDLKETTAAKQKLQSELQLAHNIQMDMLPKGGLGGGDERFELAATLVPARDVGGDLYYYFMDDGQVGLLVGDVSGKGIPAALFMARTKTLFETIARSAESVGDALSLVNDSLSADNDAGMFVTVFAGVFDPNTGRLVCAAGGHDAPVLIPGDGSPTRFLDIDGGPIIGLLPVAQCPNNEVSLAPGDAIVISTDGVFEARNIKEDFFSEERLLEVLNGKKDHAAIDVTEGLLKQVQQFAGDAEQSDDITIMTLRYKG